MPFGIAPGGQPGIKYPIRTPLSGYFDNGSGRPLLAIKAQRVNNED
jgi:hypothetical protein